MSKQKPMLMESPLTDCVYIVTSYVDNGNGMFTARQKHDVTEQFEAIAKHRERNAELGSGKVGEAIAKLRQTVRDAFSKTHISMLEEGNAIMRAIDDVEAAELGSGTCELHDCDGSFSAVNRPVWRCDCGAFMTQYTDATTYHKPRFCPNCGRRVKRC